LRVIAGLSVLAAALAYFTYPTNVPTADAGHGTRQTRHTHKQMPHQCNDARKAITYYRGKTWEAQDELHQSRFPTLYPERTPGRCAYIQYAASRWHGNSRHANGRLFYLQTTPKAAICYVFGSYCSQALAVSWCESRYHITANNGQYLGLFQMGEYARSRYGHGNDALTQSFAAHEYFLDAGWGPWSCKP